MKMQIKMTWVVVVACLLLAGRWAAAGSLNVSGDFNVSSNTSARSFFVTGGEDFSWFRWGLYRPADLGYGLALTRDDSCEAGALTLTLGWCGKSGIHAYSDTNGAPTELGINFNGGQVTFGTLYASDGFNVTTNAVFGSDVTVEGKLNVLGGMDPPYLLLDVQTREGIAARVAREVTPEKQGGAVLYFEHTSKRLEIYVPAEGAYYDLAGKILLVISPPKAAVTIGTRYRFDAETGEVVAQQTVTRPRYTLRKGYVFDTTDGQFYRLSSGGGRGVAARTAVEASEAVAPTR